MSAYYNELDPYAAAWLRNLISAGHIAPGVVDERDIRDILPSELASFTQCHFFAGIGVWSHALRQAGWPDDRPVWTGSCPCQPFSAAGAGLGFADERHLWPAWHHLIKERRPECVFGEQVASSDSGPWIDLVHDDMEALGYAFGAVPFPSAGIGAPHIRDRLYFVAHANNARLEGRNAGALGNKRLAGERSGGAGGLAHLHNSGCTSRGEGLAPVGYGPPTGADRGACGMADTDGRHTSAEREQRSGEQRQQPQNGGPVPSDAASPVNGFWRAADWLFCRDGKWRPARPGSFPLAHGATRRVGRLRAYGNAINAEAARVFIRAYLDSSMKAAA